MKLRRQNVDEENGDKEVERVERPAKKGGADCVPFLRVEKWFRRIELKARDSSR